VKHFSGDRIADDGHRIESLFAAEHAAAQEGEQVGIGRDRPIDREAAAGDIDDLMGMGDVRSKPRKDAVFTEALDLERRDDWPGAVQVLESALKAWPSDFGLRAELAMALSMTGERQDLVRAIAVSEDVLENCPDEKLLSTVRASLCYLYKAAGQPEKALALGRTLPHIWESREMLLPGLVPEKERAAQVERSLNIALQVMGDMAGNRPIPFSLGYRPEADVDTTGLLAALGGE